MPSFETRDLSDLEQAPRWVQSRFSVLLECDTLLSKDEESSKSLPSLVRSVSAKFNLGTVVVMSVTDAVFSCL